MITALREIVPPVLPVVTVAQAKQHCRIDYDADDDYIAFLIASATDSAQNYLNRSLITRTLRWVIARDSNQMAGLYGGMMGGGLATMFPLAYGYSGAMGGLQLPRAPLQSIVEVRRGDLVLDPSAYFSNIGTEPGTLRLALAGQACSPAGLSVTYTAGYGDTPATVPPAIRHAILCAVGASYQHRGDEDGGEPPAAFYVLLDPFKLDTF